MKCVNIKLWIILGCFHYILKAPRTMYLMFKFPLSGILRLSTEKDAKKSTCEEVMKPSRFFGFFWRGGGGGGVDRIPFKINICTCKLLPLSAAEEKRWLGI